MKNRLHRIILAASILVLGLGHAAKAQWVHANAGLTINEVNSFATIGSTIFAGTGNISGNGQGVFKSVDNGANWTAVNNGFLSLDVRRITAVGDTLFAAVAGINITDGGIYRSIDNGANWVQTSTGLTRKLSFSLVNFEGTLYTAISATGGVKDVYLSTDRGDSWTITSSAVLNNNTIKSMVRSGGNIIACADDGTEGVFLSTDNGATWNTTSITIETDALIVLGSTVFAATSDGVMKSTDNGATWNTTANTAGVIDNATTLAVIGTCLIVGTPGGHIYSSSDNGTTWTDVSSGASGSLGAEAFGRTSTDLFAGMNFTGTAVWRRPISEFACGGATAIETMQGSNMVEVYPNPSTGKFTVIAPELFSEIKIFNLTGGIIYSEKINSPITQIDLTGKPKGVYYYTLSGSTGKIVIE